MRRAFERFGGMVEAGVVVTRKQRENNPRPFERYIFAIS